MRWPLLFLALVSTSLAIGCNDEPAVGEPLSADALKDPQSCAQCHAEHVRQWSGSMHAYAAEDPVFLAMNARGQRETDGALGDFCVKCHAPLAVLSGATTDGLNLDEVPANEKGITCYFCHSVVAVEGTHNNPLVTANDGVMRGPIPLPLPTPAHQSAYSPLHDRDTQRSSAMCGACHDIVTPAGVALERTFAEWKETLFAHDDENGLSCGRCHMPGANAPVAQVDGAPVRRSHSHLFAGVDVALTDDFPERETQRATVQRLLDITVFGQICVSPLGGGLTEVTVGYESFATGHNFPSGASQDRSAWVQVVATAGDDVVYSSGVIPEGTPVAEIDDPDLWVLGDEMFNDDGEPVHHFWEARSVTGEALPGATAAKPEDPGWIDPHIVKRYLIAGVSPDRVTAQMFVRPIRLDTLDDLIASGDLDPSIRDAMPTFSMRTSQLQWRAELGERCNPVSRFVPSGP